jgi:vitamin B12 transporter
VLRLLVAFMLMLVPALVLAQEDTVYLDEVKVLGIPLSRYTPGSKIQSIKAEQGTTLVDALSNESPLYFKTYGNGQLATVSFRGTSASHTAVLWNGMNVNSPTLGQTDFSLWPAFLLEEISLQYGAGSSLYGTDALGGSVLLNQAQPKFEKDKQLEFRQEVGSFGHWLSGIKTTFSSGKLEFRSKAFYRSIENDFKYTSPKVGFEKKQTHAGVDNYGFDQQIHWKISEAKQLTAHGQYVYNFREVQPTVTNDNSDEVLQDRNTRVAFSYQQDFQNGNLFATVGYVLNDQLYNRKSRTKSDQLNAILQYDFDLGKKINFRIGGNATKYFATSSGFDGGLTENRYDGFVSLRYRPVTFWLTSLNLRQGVYSKRAAPFAPSWGNEFTLRDGKKTKINLRTQLARAYRVPTLNDRYWIPGGNPELKSEAGYNAELGFDLTHRISSNEFNVDVTHYRSWIDQWIIWLPNASGLWSPSNLSKVNVSGMESSLKYSYKNESFRIHSGINYAFTQSLNKKGLNDSDVTTINKQLPYVPVHSGHATIKVERKSWVTSVQSNFTGIRYTTLDNEKHQSLKAYTLLSASLGKDFLLKQYSLSLRLTANNLLNTYYENIENRSMPGRNYLLTLTLKFKS